MPTTRMRSSACTVSVPSLPQLYHANVIYTYRCRHSTHDFRGSRNHLAGAQDQVWLRVNLVQSDFGC
jgi:hypothetical protein